MARSKKKLDIIVTKDTAHFPLGLASVDRGFGRYLISQGKADYATTANQLSFVTQKQQLEKQISQAQERATALKSQVDNKVLVFTGNVGVEGKLFGSIGIKDIVKQMHASYGVTLSSENVLLALPIRNKGVYEVKLRLHTAIEANILVVIEHSKEDAEIILNNYRDNYRAGQAIVSAEKEDILLPIPPLE